MRLTPAGKMDSARALEQSTYNSNVISLVAAIACSEKMTSQRKVVNPSTLDVATYFMQQCKDQDRFFIDIIPLKVQ